MEECYLYNFTKSNIPPWLFFTFLKLHKCYQIAQSVSSTEWLTTYTQLPTLQIIVHIRSKGVHIQLSEKGSFHWNKQTISLQIF